MDRELATTVPELQVEDTLSREEILVMRSQFIPKACGMHFEKAPLKVIKAEKQYIYSETKEEYLDCVNCVAHVGHCHPQVVAAGKQAMKCMGAGAIQIGLGISDTARDYIAKLRVTLPPELDTFLFVSSGSEANDLAIQLARLHSGGHDVVAVDRAFHGSLILTNDVSPRQYTSPSKIPEFVHVVPCPDLYRGKHRETDTKAVDKYCQEARDVMTGAVAKDRKLACFISEPIMTVPGVIIPPSEWMHSVYRDIRKLGGLAIADEAQSGLGRSGKTWWSFQVHEHLVPDILTIGKPLCNGHPTAVVVTRSSIAARLGYEGISSFQCDSVTAAVGIAVIDVVRSENLMMNAHNVGSFLREGLKSLAGAHPNIGHVRGSGFMIGVEIVYNRESRKPAMSIAEKICYKMKEEYCIIMANGGTFMNVLVMTPPMCFSYTDALRVITTLGKILTQIENEGIDNMEEESTGSSYYSLHGSNSLEPERLISVGWLAPESEKKDEDDNSDEDPYGGNTTSIFDMLD